MTAPSNLIETVERIAFETRDQLPPIFRDWLGPVVTQVLPFAPREILDDMGIESRWGLLGLYQGAPVGEKSVWESGALPDMIHLYAEPIAAYARDEGETLEAVVAHVMVHEVGHHFGLSDEDMHRIEDEAD